MTDPSADDIRALIVDGDLRRYLRDLRRPTRTQAPARDGPGSTTTYGPTHRTGAWPHPTRPPNAATCRPDCPCAIHPPNPPRHPNGSAPT